MQRKWCNVEDDEELNAIFVCTQYALQQEFMSHSKTNYWYSNEVRRRIVHSLGMVQDRYRERVQIMHSEGREKRGDKGGGNITRIGLGTPGTRQIL